MNDVDEVRTALLNELLAYVEAQQFVIKGVRGLVGHPFPPMLHNDGYGDQRDKMPDLLAIDPASGAQLIGAVRTSRAELDSLESQTEYDVYLDQKNERTGNASLVYVIMPASLGTEFTLFIHHYIHHEYWSRIIPVLSRTVT